MKKILYPKNVYWMDLQTGELVTYKKMLDILENEFDFNDYTNCLEIFEYFESTDIKNEPVTAGAESR